MHRVFVLYDIAGTRLAAYDSNTEARQHKAACRVTCYSYDIVDGQQVNATYEWSQ